MLEPTRPDPTTLSEALHCAATLDLPIAKIIAEEFRWQEWAVNKWRGRCDYLWPDDLGWDGIADCLQQLELHIKTIGRQAGKIEQYEGEINELRESNAAMVRQLRDQDLRAERQHRQWDEKMRNLQDEFDALRGRKEASDGNVTSLKAKLERVQRAIQSFDELLKK